MRRGLRFIRVLQMMLIAVAITGMASTPEAEADCSSGLWATATPSEGPAPLTVQFSASNGGVGCYAGLDNYVKPYSWFGGDPDAYNLDLWSLEQNFTYTFTKAGRYEWNSNIFWPDEWGGCDQCSKYGIITVTGSEEPTSSKGGPADLPNTEFEGGDGPGECGGGMPNYWINTSSLNLFIEDPVFSYQGLGPGIRMTHSYNADPSQSGMFGKGWSFAYESSISQTCTEATLTKGSGATLKYTATLCSGGNPATPPVEATPPEGQHDRLTWNGDYWLLVEKATFFTYRYDKVSGTSQYLLSSITDANGNAVQITYNTDKAIQKITDAAGRATTFAYDSNKRCTLMTTPDGRQATYQYDANGNLTTTTDLAGYATVYSYDANNYLVSLAAAGKTMGFSYNESGGWKHIASVTNAGGKTTQYQVGSATPRTIKSTDPRGGITTYGSSKNLTSTVTNPLIQTTSTSYSKGHPSTSTNALGGVTKMEYDARGNLTKLTDPLGKVTTYVYDAKDNLISKTNPLGETWTYTYNTRHNLTKKKSPMGHETLMTYNAKGQLTATTDPAGKTISFTYNAFGNVSTITEPLGNKTTMSYDTYGFAMTSRKDARSNVTQYSYDENGRLVQETYPDGSFKSHGYDCCAASSVTDENGYTTQFNRDSLLNITEIIDALGGKTNKQYDENSNLVSVTDALSRTSTISYDAANRPNLRTNFLGWTVENAFDANGNLVSVEDEQEKVTAFAYDANNRPVSTTDPLGYQVTQNRDALGRTTLLSNARGGTVGYTYNADGLRTAKSHSGVTVATFAYDSASNMTSMTDSTGTTTFSYDGNRRVTAISYPDGLSVSLAYDAVGNLKSVNYPGGLVVSYTHDNRNRPASVSWGGNSISLTHDPVGNLTEETRSNGTKTTYSYDSNNRVIDIRHSRGTTPFAHIAYTRNALGNTVQETPVVPLIPNFTASSTAATYNDANQIVTRATNTYAYDADGNIINVSGSSFSLVNHTYDEENRLSSSLEGIVLITYTYNGLGERTRVATGGQTRTYHYAPTGRLLFETDGGDQPTVFYIYGGARLLALGNPSGGYSFYHFDKTGSTVALTDTAGNVSAAYAYLPFGSINRSGSVYNPFTFVGAHGVMEDGNGQYFMRNRYYGSGTKRFYQKDPIGFAAGQTNLYAYVGNNPVDAIDPLGLMSELGADRLADTFHNMPSEPQKESPLMSNLRYGMRNIWRTIKINLKRMWEGKNTFVEMGEDEYSLNWKCHVGPPQGVERDEPAQGNSSIHAEARAKQMIFEKYWESRGMKYRHGRVYDAAGRRFF